MNPILKHVDDWLLKYKEVDTDHGGNGNRYIEFKVRRHNHYNNVIFSLKNDTVLAWYAEPCISGEDIALSPYRELLAPYLFRSNERLALGRWSETQTGALLFDVSVPINGVAPHAWLLTRLYEIVCDTFDLMLSRVRLLLEYGLAVESPNDMVSAECLAFAAGDLSILARLESLGLVNKVASKAIHDPVSPRSSSWSKSLQAQTYSAIEELWCIPDGLLHMKHKSLGYGVLQLERLANRELELHIDKDSKVLHFQSAQDLINTGWAID